MKQLIHQKLEVKEWPLSKPGEEAFFGYVVALGIFVSEWGVENGAVAYVDFAYNDAYTRYRLPTDASLTKQLREVLLENIAHTHEGAGMYGKVYIKRLAHGYVVALP